MTIFAFIAGCIVGTAAGIVAISMCAIAADADERLSHGLPPGCQLTVGGRVYTVTDSHDESFEG